LIVPETKNGLSSYLDNDHDPEEGWI